VAYVGSYDLELKVNSNNIFPILHFLQKHTIYKFEILSDMICYDTPGKALRFCIVYSLLSIKYNTRLRLITRLRGASALLSISSLFFGAV
jgi:NADH:ubiquinone oxidoreductase subunit C